MAKAVTIEGSTTKAEYGYNSDDQLSSVKTLVNCQVQKFIS